jgi:hypothetical protein
VQGSPPWSETPSDVNLELRAEQAESTSGPGPAKPGRSIHVPDGWRPYLPGHLLALSGFNAPA